MIKEDRQQAFVYIKDFVNKNKILLSNKGFEKINFANSVEDLEEIFNVYDINLKWYQQLFSIKNSTDKSHKIIYILGLKFSIRRKNNG